MVRVGPGLGLLPSLTLIGVLVTRLSADPIGPNAGYLLGKRWLVAPVCSHFSELLGTS